MKCSLTITTYPRHPSIRKWSGHATIWISHPAWLRSYLSSLVNCGLVAGLIPFKLVTRGYQVSLRDMNKKIVATFEWLLQVTWFLRSWILHAESSFTYNSCIALLSTSKTFHVIDNSPPSSHPIVYQDQINFHVL